MPATDQPAFALDPRLQADTLLIGELPLCRVLRMNDARYRWLILVPRRPQITEVYHLAPHDQAVLWREVTRAGEQLMRLTSADKLNIGALGNLVPQLHVHIIARSEGDAAWPGPVWGVGRAQPLAAADQSAALAEFGTIVSLGA